MKNKINKLQCILTIILALSMFSFANGCKKDDSSTNSNPATNPGTNEIIMQGNTFSPANKTITQGSIVTWINKDSYNHTVTSGTPGSPDGMFDSGNIGASGSFSFKFDTKGTYSYYCKIHSPMMAGTITVQ